MTRKTKIPLTLRPSIGSHIDRHPYLNPRNPEPKPPGEKRGLGKPFIKMLTRSAISYKLRENGQVFIHHEDGPETITLPNAPEFIRDWLGLSEDDYLQIVKVTHSFVQDNKPTFPSYHGK